MTASMFPDYGSICLASLPLHRGWNLSNEGIIMSIHKHNESIDFDQVLETTSGAITGVIMQPVQIPNVNVGVDSLVYNQTAPTNIQEDDPVPVIVQ
jgi:hypothetical protein